MTSKISTKKLHMRNQVKGQWITDFSTYLSLTRRSAIIQHRGQSIQLNTAADVAAWIAERKKRFPTAARIAMKKAAQDQAQSQQQKARDAEKQQRLVARSKAVQAKLIKKKPKDEPDLIKAKLSESSDQMEVEVPTLDDPMARIAALEEQLRQAREALAGQSSLKGMEAIKKENASESYGQVLECDGAIHQNDEEDTPMQIEATASDSKLQGPKAIANGLGLAYDSDADEDANSDLDLSSEDPSSDSSDEESDSDAPPEESSAKQVSNLQSQSTTPMGANKSQICNAFANTGRCKYGDKCMRSHVVPCRFYKKNGYCRYGDKCRMSHNVTPGTGKKKSVEKAAPLRPMSLRERMIEKELMEEAARGLVVIKQLGTNGFFSEL